MAASLFFLCIPVLVVASPAGQATINAKAPEFLLRDQYDRSFDLRQREGRTIVLVASDGEGSKHNRQWVDAIKERYRDRIVIVGIADTRGVPFFLKSYVKNKFKKSSDLLLLDWNGTVFKSYGLAPHVSNIVLIDKHGIVRSIVAGEATPEACNMLFHEIDNLER